MGTDMRKIIAGLVPAAGGAGGALLATALGGGPVPVAACAGLGALAAVLGAGMAPGRIKDDAAFVPSQSAAVPASLPQPLAVAEPREPTGLPQGVGRALIERLPIGIVILDTGGQIIFVNEKAAGFFGRRVPVNRNVSVIRVPALLDAIERAGESGEPAELDIRITRDGSLDLHAHVMPLRSGLVAAAAPDDQPGMVIVIEDHTRTRRAEQLQRDFVANASHELKTPLASILGFIETLQGHARHDEEARNRFLDIMAAQTLRMKRLVEDLLSLNRIELNEHVQPREAQPVKRIVWEVVAALRPLAESRGMHVEADPASDLPAVPGHRDELAQVFVNLIDNAIKYGDAGSEVRVFEAAPRPGREGMVGISVADQGQGIAREHLPRLTERFYRISVPRSRAKGGTGLGLAIVKHILTRHRGHLDVDSEVGVGAVFTVWLPRHNGVAAPTAAPTELVAAPEGPTPAADVSHARVG